LPTSSRRASGRARISIDHVECDPELRFRLDGPGVCDPANFFDACSTMMTVRVTLLKKELATSQMPPSER
jgi:hypothetical protein